jgi:hypothetical protein
MRRLMWHACNVSQPTISRLLGDRPFEASAGDAAQP